MKALGSLLMGLFFVCSLVVTDVAADVSGSATLELPGGKVPGRRKLNMAADPVCAGKHTSAALSERLITNEKGQLQNVFVYVSKGLEGKEFDVPSEPVVLDQNGCLYKPHVLGVRAGQTIRILNSDGTLHNIHPKPKVNAEFNQAMPKFLKKKDKIFDKAEQMIPVRCDVHPWMQAHIGVMDHPYFAVSGADGAFTIEGLPDGTYTVTAWHEICGSMDQEVTVKDGAASVSFAMKLPKRK